MPSRRLNLTPAVLKSLPADGAEHWLHDDGGPKSVAGLAIRVHGSGAATFVLSKKVAGRLARVVVGKVGDITLTDARESARRTLAEITLTGASPNEAKRARRDRGVTLGTAFEDFMDGRGVKPNTVLSYRQAMTRQLKPWEHRPLAEITRADVRVLYAKLAAKSPANANLAMRLLRAVFNHARGEYLDESGRPLIVDNPVQELSRKRAWKKVEPRRARIASRDLGAWLDAVDTLRSASPVSADFLEVLLFTGLRRREAEPLEWSAVDLREAVVRVEDTKGGRPLEVPISDHVVELLRRRQAEAPGRFVFPGSGASGHIVECKRAADSIAKRSGVVATPHALRRTFASVAESIELSPYVLKRLIGHAVASNDVLGMHYASAIETDRLRVATQRITDAILEHAGRRTAENMIALEARRA